MKDSYLPQVETATVRRDSVEFRSKNFDLHAKMTMLQYAWSKFIQEDNSVPPRQPLLVNAKCHVRLLNFAVLLDKYLKWNMIDR